MIRCSFAIRRPPKRRLESPSNGSRSSSKKSDVIDAGERHGRHGKESHYIHVEDRRNPDRAELTHTQHDTNSNPPIIARDSLSRSGEGVYLPFTMSHRSGQIAPRHEADDRQPDPKNVEHRAERESQQHEGIDERGKEIGEVDITAIDAGHLRAFVGANGAQIWNASYAVKPRIGDGTNDQENRRQQRSAGSGITRSDHRKGGDRIGPDDHLAHANALRELAEKISRTQNKLARRNQDAAGFLAEIAFDHEKRAIDEERRPEAGPAESNDPAEPEARLTHETADIDTRVLRRPPCGLDDGMGVEPEIPENQDHQAGCRDAQELRGPGPIVLVEPDPQEGSDGPGHGRESEPHRLGTNQVHLADMIENIEGERNIEGCRTDIAQIHAADLAEKRMGAKGERSEDQPDRAARIDPAPRHIAEEHRQSQRRHQDRKAYASEQH